MNQKLGSTAREEIRKSMTGLVGSAARGEATRLADLHNCSVPHIYEMTADLRQGKRKKRADAGTRKFVFEPGTDTWEAATLVIGAKFDPDQALDTAKANGHSDLPSLSYFQKRLREEGINRKQLRAGRRNHRRFEAAAPLDVVQIDSSALKVRWLDYKTRRIIRIEGIDKNHPQLDSSMLRVWQIVAVDDHTRRRKVKYLAANHITSADMVRFLSELVDEWGGLPKMIYTDNGPEFHRFFAQAVRILQKIQIVIDSGGFEHKTHAPGNAQASGKVEIAHQRVEKMNRFIGLAEQKGLEVRLDDLVDFAASIDRYDNEVKVHRATGQTPIARWYGTRITPRVLPVDMIRSALLFSEADKTIASDMTIVIDKIKYRLPVKNEKTGEYSGLKAGMKINVIIPHEFDEIFITLPNKSEIAVLKREAMVDVAGEFKTATPARGEILTKALNEHHKQKNREAKNQKQLTGEVYQIPHFNQAVAVPDTNVVHGAFAHPEISVTAEDVQTSTPVPMSEVAPSAAGSPPYEGGVAGCRGGSLGSENRVAYVGRPVGYWECVSEFADRFPDKQAAKAFLLELFPNMGGTHPVTEVEAAIDRYLNPQKEAAQLRIAS